jgi:hypothetical protein
MSDAYHGPVRHPRLLVDEKVLESKEAMWSFYEDWCKFHGRLRDPQEMARRFKTFSDNARLVHQISSAGHCAPAMTRYADMTKKEASHLYGYRRSKK